MTNLFRNSSPGALTMQQAIALAKKRMAEHRRRLRQAQELAAQGRGEDTEVAHVARGEYVIPQALQTPEVLAALHRAAADCGVPLQRLNVGHAMNSINPDTDMPEFGILGTVWDWSAKALGKVAEPFERERPVAVVRPMEVAPDTMPSNDVLQYDSNGPSEWGAAWNDPMGAASALWHAERAKQEATDRFDDDFNRSSLQGGEGDAWRHARWGQRLANSIGAERAKAFMDAHERGEPNPIGSRSMDLYNNEQGRLLEGDNTKATIDNLLYRGYLRKTWY
ncbi:MAG: hypothetical protein K2P94_04735 [Rhodospirillaceae bacterium]|nr:hypothetical protein [Rhodospirillaceae bacterium]